MKILTFLIILFVSTKLYIQRPEICPANADKCKAILDSAKILVQTGEFSINWEPKTFDKERNNRIAIWFQTKSFSELKCLLDSDNKLYKFYAYTLAAMFHKDSLKNNYTNLFNDTSTVQYNTKKGLVDTKMTLGTMVKLMVGKIEEDNVNWNKRPEIETKISLFIKEYSTYPETYTSISFPDFSMSSDNDGLSGYNIRHQYEIKNNSGRIVKVTSAFVLGPKLNISVIEQDSSKYISAIPPKLSDWFAEYGREQNLNDSINLNYK